MYVRVAVRRNTSGQPVRYVQLAHNEWDPDAGMSRTRVLHSFGREEDLDRASIERLISSLARLLDADRANAVRLSAGVAVESHPMGGAYVLDALWRRLGIDVTLRRQLSGRDLDPAAERVLFALVAGRALRRGPDVDERHRRQAMDSLCEVEEALAREVYRAAVEVLRHEVGLLFFDAVTVHMVTAEPRDAGGDDAPDATAVLDLSGAGPAGGSQFRDHLRRIVVGVAATRDGIPVRACSLPGGDTAAPAYHRIRADVREWSASRLVWVDERAEAARRGDERVLRDADHVIAESAYSDAADVRAALARPGRYASVGGGLRVKHAGLRLVVCHSEEQARRDRRLRGHLLARLHQLIDDSDRLAPAERAELRETILATPALRPFLRVTPKGRLRVDQARVHRDAALAGRTPLRCSDDTLSGADVALAYQQLQEVRRAWRDVTHLLDLRFGTGRPEPCLRAHVALSWLTLLLVRIAETETGRAWRVLRAELDLLHTVTVTGRAGAYGQTTDLTDAQREILAALAITPPHRVIDPGRTSE